MTYKKARKCMREGLLVRLPQWHENSAIGYPGTQRMALWFRRTETCWQPWLAFMPNELHTLAENWELVPQSRMP